MNRAELDESWLSTLWQTKKAAPKIEATGRSSASAVPLLSAFQHRLSTSRRGLSSFFASVPSLPLQHTSIITLGYCMKLNLLTRIVSTSIKHLEVHSTQQVAHSEPPVSWRASLSSGGWGRKEWGRKRALEDPEEGRSAQAWASNKNNFQAIYWRFIGWLLSWGCFYIYVMCSSHIKAVGAGFLLTDPK